MLSELQNPEEDHTNWSHQVNVVPNRVDIRNALNHNLSHFINEEVECKGKQNQLKYYVHNGNLVIRFSALINEVCVDYEADMECNEWVYDQLNDSLFHQVIVEVNNSLDSLVFEVRVVLSL